MTTEVTNLWAARIINLPAAQSLKHFFSKQLGPDKLVWRWRHSQPPLSLHLSPWMCASPTDNTVTANPLCKLFGLNYPSHHLSRGSHLVLQVLHFHLPPRAVVAQLPIHRIVIEHMCIWCCLEEQDKLHSHSSTEPFMHTIPRGEGFSWFSFSWHPQI